MPATIGVMANGVPIQALPPATPPTPTPAPPPPAPAPAPAPAPSPPRTLATVEAAKPPPAPVPSSQQPSQSQIIALLDGHPIPQAAAEQQAKQEAAAAAVAAAAEAKGAPLTTKESSAAAAAGAAAVQPGTQVTPAGTAAAAAAGAAVVPTAPPAPAGPSLTHAELEALWSLAGGLPGTEDTAAAIAEAESGGCQYALAGPVDIRPVKSCKWTKTDGENSCGFWQINLRAHPTYSAPSIFDKLTNAKAAVAISKGGTNFEPWTTYKTGAYKKYLTSGGVPAPQPGAGGAAPTTVNVPAGIGKAWSSVLDVYATKVPQQHTNVRKLADSFTTIFQ